MAPAGEAIELSKIASRLFQGCRRAVEASEWIEFLNEVQVFVDGALHTSQDASFIALRPEPHRDLLLKARVNPVLSNDTCGRGNFSLAM